MKLFEKLEQQDKSKYLSSFYYPKAVQQKTINENKAKCNDYQKNVRLLRK